MKPTEKTMSGTKRPKRELADALLPIRPIAVEAERKSPSRATN
jgi:hypothetical protein